MTDLSALRRLARALGIQTAYRDSEGARRMAHPDVLLAVVRALGIDIARIGDAPSALAEFHRNDREPGCGPVVVAWNGVLAEMACMAGANSEVRSAHVALESGGDAQLTTDGFTLSTPRGKPLPLGYHRLVVETRGGQHTSLVVAAPRRAPVQAAAGWGVFLPIHALRTPEDWGIGDYSGLGELAVWVGEAGGSFTGVLPLLPMFLGDPFEPSPYAPISRRFWSELYIDVRDMPCFREDLDLGTAVLGELDAMRASPVVEYRRTAALKRDVVNRAADRFFVNGAPASDFHDFVRHRTDALPYARFRAACDQHGCGWNAWPQSRPTDLGEGDVPARTTHRHLFAAWVADRQMRAAARRAESAGSTLYLDLPLGVHRHGFDTWRDPEVFVDDMSAGAPPDALFRGGQDWGVPPLSPLALRNTGFAYFVATLRHHLCCAKVLRLDHVMAVQRLFWVPRGASARDGVYVRYPADETLAVLTLEAQRHGATLVGEDLGTVPRSIRRAMRRHGIQRMFVAQFEAGASRNPPLPEPSADAMASLNTHDMFPFAAYWSGRDIDDQVARGWVTREAAVAMRAARARTRRNIRRQLGLSSSDDAGDAAAARDACHAWLAAGRAGRVLVNLEDLWLEDRPQNVPGTPSAENWRRRAALDLDSMRRHCEPQLRTVASMRTGRTTKPTIRK